MAGREDIGGLVARITADTSGLRSDMTKAQKQINSSAGRMNRSLSKIDKSTARLSKGFSSLRGVIAGAATAMAARFVKANLDASAQLLDTSQKIGVQVESLQSLRFAAMQYGVQQNVTDMALQRFSRRVGEAVQGQGELMKTIEQYNIRLTTSEGKTRSVEAVLMDYADTIKNAESQQEALRLAFKGFDSEGAALVNLLRGGSEALTDFDRRARELGVVMDKQLIEKARQGSIDLNIMANVMRTQISVAVAENAEAFSQFGQMASAAIGGVVSKVGVLLGKLNNLGVALSHAISGDFEGASLAFSGHLTGGVQGGGGGSSGPAPSPFAMPGGGTVGGGGESDPLARLRISIDTTRFLILESTQEAHKAVADSEKSLTSIVAQEAQRRADIEQQAQSQITQMRMASAHAAAGFLQALGAEHKGAAIAALAIQKTLAIKEVLIQSQVAAMRAMAELGPIAGPPVAAAILTKGKISSAFIAATGLVEASQISSGTASLGTSANPVHVQPTSNALGDSGQQAVRGATQRHVTQFVFNGPVDVKHLMRLIKRETRDSDELIIDNDSLQASMLRA